MTQCSESEFTKRLLEVANKLAGIANNQTNRFKQRWNETLSSLNDDPYLVRTIPYPINKEEFTSNIDYRIEILKTFENAIADGYYTIRTLLETLYGAYFSSKEFKSKFSPDDQNTIIYLTAKEILGNLIQYNIMDHETVPLKYNILARNYVTMKLQGINDMEIQQNMKKLNLNLSLEEVNTLMGEIEVDGFITSSKSGERTNFKLKKELKLSEEGEKEYTSTIQVLIAWPTQFWRSFYNIRELNLTPNEDVPHREFLTTALAKSATQGLSATQYVIKNLIKYYEKLKEE